MCSHVAVHVGARDRCRQEYQAKTLTPLIIPNSIIPLLGEPDSAFFAWPTLKNSPPTRPRAPNLQKNLGSWISTRLVAFGVLHRRHNKLADHYAAALKNWTDVQLFDPRSCPWTSTLTTHDDTMPDESGTHTTSVTKENTKSPCVLNAPCVLTPHWSAPSNQTPMLGKNTPSRAQHLSYNCRDAAPFHHQPNATLSRTLVHSEALSLLPCCHWTRNAILATILLEHQPCENDCPPYPVCI